MSAFSGEEVSFSVSGSFKEVSAFFAFCASAPVVTSSLSDGAAEFTLTVRAADS